MNKFRKLINWSALITSILLGVLIPIVGVESCSFLSVCLGLILIINGVHIFTDEQGKIKKLEEKESKKTIAQ